MNNLSQILSPEYHIYSQGKYKDQKDGVKYRFLFVSHLFTLSYTVFTTFVWFLYLISVCPGILTYLSQKYYSLSIISYPDFPAYHKL